MDRREQLAAKLLPGAGRLPPLPDSMASVRVASAFFNSCLVIRLSTTELRPPGLLEPLAAVRLGGGAFWASCALPCTAALHLHACAHRGTGTHHAGRHSSESPWWVHVHRTQSAQSLSKLPIRTRTDVMVHFNCSHLLLACCIKAIKSYFRYYFLLS
jgi:hypothetical protein